MILSHRDSHDNDLCRNTICVKNPQCDRVGHLYVQMEEVTSTGPLGCFCFQCSVSRQRQPQQRAKQKPQQKKTKPINPVLACIVLAVQRIYGTVDNTYTLTLVFLMLTWTLHKMSMFKRASDNHRAQWALDVCLDCVMLSTLIYTGIMTQARSCCVFFFLMVSLLSIAATLHVQPDSTRQLADGKSCKHHLRPNTAVAPCSRHAQPRLAGRALSLGGPMMGACQVRRPNKPLTPLGLRLL